MKNSKKQKLLKSIIMLIFALSLTLSLVVFASAEDDDTAKNDSKPCAENIKYDQSDVEDLVKSYIPKMSITLDSNFVLNVYIPVKNTLNFTFDGVFYESQKICDMITSIGGEDYYRVFVELPAAEAARNISLSVNLKYGESSLCGSFTFSILKYAKYILESEFQGVEKKLLKDALAYISSSYAYFNNEDADAVSESIAEIIGDHKETVAISAKDSPQNTYLSSAAFVLDSKPGIKFYLKGGKDKSSYEFFAGGRKINRVTEGEDDNGKYLFINLYSYKMCGSVSYTVDGENAGSYGICNYYSYVSKNSFKDTKKTELRELLRKFYNYSMSAAEYYVKCNSTEAAPDSVNLKNYATIYPSKFNTTITKCADRLALAIKNKCEISIPVSSHLTPEERKIFVGNSSLVPNVSEVRLSMEDSEDAFIIDFSEDYIAIFGKTEQSTARAVEYFIENYVNKSEDGVISLSDKATVIKPFIALENGSEIVVENVSTVLEVIPEIYYDGLYPSKLSRAYYPSVIELKHNGDNNGKLIAILAVNDNPTASYKELDTNSCVMESTDGGISWKMIARPMETINPTYIGEDGTEYKIQGISMAHIYELPKQVGDMPAGTLLYSGTSVNYDCYSQIAIWRSFDCGYTWEEYTVIATGGGSKEGVWEPFTWYEESDGYLYCFYSDDSDPAHDQKLVYKRSRDGINWSEAVGMCVFDKQADRPGMTILTEMGSGEYFMVYEHYGTYGGRIFYKITDDISVWNPTVEGTMLKDGNGYTIKGGPSCIWTSAGGDNGILIVSGKADYDGGQQHLLFVSFDYGRSFSTIQNPLPYDITLDVNETNRIGHSASFVVSSDPSVIYYLNTTVNAETGLQRVECAKLKIYG